MKIVKPYDQLLTSDKKYIMLRSGRVSGKTKASCQKIIYNTNKYPERDVIVCRSAFSDLRESIYQELLVVIEEEGLSHLYKAKTAPMMIEHKITKSIIYFKGIGGSDASRSRGFKPKHKISMIFIDEAQQLKTQANLEQGLATYRRSLDTSISQIIMAFNPEPVSMHWLNEFYRLNKRNPDYLMIESSYKDIAGVLNDQDIRAIEMERVLNPRNYDYMYLGITNGLFGGVYYTFDRNKHMISELKAQETIKRIGIHSVFFGVDGATTRDSTAVVPIFLLMNGRAIAGDRFYHNPKETRPLSNTQLIPLIDKYTKVLVKKYNISYMTPKYFVVDPASADLKTSLAYHNFGNNYSVFNFGKKDILNMAKTVQNVFSRNICMVVDTNGYMNYVNGNFVYDEKPFPNQLESVIWNESGSGFDDTIPNDITDAFTYGINLIFKNPDNLYLPQIKDYYQV